MAKKKTKKTVKKVIDKVIKKPKKSTKFVIGSLGYLGGVAILSVNEKVVDFKKYNEVTRIDGTAYMLSDKDLKVQVTIKQVIPEPSPR